MAIYAASALELTNTYVNTLPYNICSTARHNTQRTPKPYDCRLYRCAISVGLTAWPRLRASNGVTYPYVLSSTPANYRDYTPTHAYLRVGH